MQSHDDDKEPFWMVQIFIYTCLTQIYFKKYLELALMQGCDTFVVIRVWKGLEREEHPQGKTLVYSCHKKQTVEWKVNVSTDVLSWWSFSLCVEESKYLQPSSPSLFIWSLQYIGKTLCTNVELLTSTSRARLKIRQTSSYLNLIEYWGNNRPKTSIKAFQVVQQV